MRQANEARALHGYEFDGKVSTWRFSTNAGSPLEHARNSSAQQIYLAKFSLDDTDMSFSSVPVWTVHTNIPHRCVRLVRQGGGQGQFFIENDLVGTWTVVGQGMLALHYEEKNRTRYYENAPGTPMWIRRSDDEDISWSTFLVPIFRGDQETDW